MAGGTLTRGDPRGQSRGGPGRVADVLEAGSRSSAGKWLLLPVDDDGAAGQHVAL